METTVVVVVRDVFLETGAVARELIASASVGERWNDAGALAHMSVGAVAAHLARGVLTVPYYMAMPLPEPAPSPVNAAQYFAAALTADIDDDLHQGIRARSDEAAAKGQDE